MTLREIDRYVTDVDLHLSEYTYQAERGLTFPVRFVLFSVAANRCTRRSSVVQSSRITAISSMSRSRCLIEQHLFVFDGLPKAGAHALRRVRDDLDIALQRLLKLLRDFE